MSKKCILEKLLTKFENQPIHLLKATVEESGEITLNNEKNTSRVTTF